MAVLLVLDEDVPRGNLKSFPENEVVVLLSLEPNLDSNKDLIRCLEKRGNSVRFRSAADDLDRIALELRDSFSELVADVPRQYKTNGLPLISSYVFEDHLSLWWLNEISSKRSDSYPTYTKICQGKLIDEVFNQEGCEKVYLLTRDNAFKLVVASLCRKLGCSLVSPLPRIGQGLKLEETSLLRLVVSTLNWFVRIFLQTLLAKLFAPRTSLSLEGICAFYTHFPTLWRGSGYQSDEKYAGVPRLLESIENLQSIYACTFSADGRHMDASVFDYLKNLFWLRARPRGKNLTPIHLIDADLSWRDYFKALFRMKIFLVYYLLEKDLHFQKQWRLAGMNIFPLIRRELRIAMSRTPRYILHLYRMRSFFNQFKPVCFVTHLFEFCYGRAMVFAAKSSESPPRVVGVQHGPISKRKLLYFHHSSEIVSEFSRETNFIDRIPLPDVIVVEGKDARDRLVEGAYPETKLKIGGAPRLSKLLDVPAWKGVNLRQNAPTNVLVAFGQHDGKMILSSCSVVLRNQKGLNLIFKLHPRSAEITAQEVVNRLQDVPKASVYQIATEDVYTLLPNCDCVVATYSSVALEAVALGYPVICLQMPNRINTSPLMDNPSKSFDLAPNPTDLGHLLEKESIRKHSSFSMQRNISSPYFEYVGARAEEEWARIIFEDVKSSQ